MFGAERDLGERDNADVDVRLRRAERDGRQCLRRKPKRADRYAVLPEREATKLESSVGGARDAAGGSPSCSVRDVNGGRADRGTRNGVHNTAMDAARHGRRLSAQDEEREKRQGKKAAQIANSDRGTEE